jgi:hypothetical protein
MQNMSNDCLTTAVTMYTAREGDTLQSIAAAP